jgi:hypothetical protein
MGFFRGAGVVIVSVLFFVSILTAGIFWTLSLSLNYDNVNSKVSSVSSSIVGEKLNSAELNKTFSLMKNYCKTNPNYSYVFKEGNYSYNLSCKNLPNSTNELLSQTTSYFVKDFYYKTYSCEFWSCFKEQGIPFFLVSKYSQDYWHKLFVKLILFSILLFVLLFFLTKRKANAFILSGALLIIASLPILKLKILGTNIVEKMFSPVGEAVSWGASKDTIANIVGVFFSESSRVFLTYFVIGIILLIAGIVFTFMSFGFKIFEKVDKIEKENETEELKEKVKQLEKKVNEKSVKKKK